MLMKFTKKSKKVLRFVLPVTGFILAIGSVALAESGGGHSNNWLTVDTWKVLNFVILIAVMFYLLKKPVVQFFSSRKKDIEDEINELEQKKSDAQKELAEYQTKFKDLDQESKKIVENYIQQGKEAKARIIAEAEAQADKLEDMAKRSIEQEFKTAKTQLKLEITKKAMEKAEEVIKASISSDDQDRLVDQYLRKVVV
jgi:F-type H+-transporting ATPase subunit b